MRAFAATIGLGRVVSKGWVLQIWSTENMEGGVNSVSFSPDGRLVVSGADDKLVKIWDSETGAEVISFVRVL